jgi:hypothetical protein
MFTLRDFQSRLLVPCDRSSKPQLNTIRIRFQADLWAHSARLPRGG